MGRLVRLSLLAAAVAAVWTATASAGDLFVGADEDAAMWSDQPVGTVARALGLKALRVTVQWHPGETDYLPTAFYAEYQSSGPGAAASRREPHATALTRQQAKKYAPQIFLRGSDGWNPTAVLKGAR